MAKPVYMAGPLFSEAERGFLEHLVEVLADSAGLDPATHFFLPHRDSGELWEHPSQEKIFGLDMDHLDSASIVVGFLDGQDVDSGTCIELGYAYAQGKRIFGIITDFRAAHDTIERPNIMVWGVCDRGGTLFRDVESLAAAFSQYVRDHPETLS
jgi:nucleoside 2-deoxyribosyltransferase